MSEADSNPRLDEVWYVEAVTPTGEEQLVLDGEMSTIINADDCPRRRRVQDVKDMVSLTRTPTKKKFVGYVTQPDEYWWGQVDRLKGPMQNCVNGHRPWPKFDTPVIPSYFESYSEHEVFGAHTPLSGEMPKNDDFKCRCPVASIGLGDKLVIF
jgi:hypothetical protein